MPQLNCERKWGTDYISARTRPGRTDRDSAPDCGPFHIVGSSDGSKQDACIHREKGASNSSKVAKQLIAPQYLIHDTRLVILDPLVGTLTPFFHTTHNATPVLNIILLHCSSTGLVDKSIPPVECSSHSGALFLTKLG